MATKVVTFLYKISGSEIYIKYELETTSSEREREMPPQLKSVKCV